MTNHNTITLKLNDVYSLSLVQGRAITSYADDFAEVALIRTHDGFDTFVRPDAWATNWVGEDYYDSVIAGCDAHDVAELLQFAKEYVYIKEHENV